LESFQQSPELIYSCLLPDPYEVEAHRPLAPVKLPIHHQEERKHREDLIRERSGLIALLNDLLAIQLPIRIVTQVLRRILAIAAASDRRHRWQRWGIKVVQGICLWWTGLMHLRQIAPLVGIFVRAWRITFASWLVRAWTNRPHGRKGTTAGSIILRSRSLRALKRVTGGFRDLIVAAFIWLFPVVLVLTLLYLLPDGTLHDSTSFLLRQAGEERAWLYRSIGKAEKWLTWAGDWAWVPWLVPLALVPSASAIGRRLSEVLLRRYSLVDSLASAYPLRQMFVRLFDPVNYYGRIDLGKMLDAALRNPEATERTTEPNKKPLSDYFTQAGIFVAPVAADIADGELQALPQEEPVVDALLAAMAVVPLFPAQRREYKGAEPAYYIDGINVANDPTSVLLKLLREKIHPQARRAKIFAVSPLPVSRPTLPDSVDQLQGLMQVVPRVLALKRFRDASLERSLTQLHTRIADEYVRRRGADKTPDTALLHVDGVSVLRADFYSIEPDLPLDLNARLSQAESTEQRRGLILAAVAEGCRSALETMIRDSISANGLPGSCSCWRAIGTHLGDNTGLPGSQRPFGPGLVEVCRACALNQGNMAKRPVLRKLEDRRCSPWPREHGGAPARSAAPTTIQAAEDAPREIPGDPASDAQNPKVALLFSGGVFRGVFQMGAINALSELEARPQIFAGASVGSITAAMATRVFASADKTERNERIALLAATFLTLDRLVLTDRFADFVRRFTLRAGAADFSIADVDRFLRRYDIGSARGLGTQGAGRP
ncbi:MAG TPA: patatin-like phospholipase family protein, partial [Thermoanaerobaculia bacterium]|nr:patatin-like phospholipase family protein [Thermoanaerobaculia bacterium]